MKPLLDEAFLLLQQYAKDKGMEEYERLALQATINNRNKHMALDIEAFNRLVTEMIESKTSSSADVFEHKLMLIRSPRWTP
jgi:hypothetical protein